MDHLTIDANGLRFDATIAGPIDAPLAVLLHGFPESRSEWNHVLPLIAATGRRVVAFDQRGYSPGARPEGIAAYHHTELVGDVLAIADALGADTFDLVGHDWGALVAWSTAASHPERIRTLSIVSVPHPRAFAAARRDDADQIERSAYISFFRTPDVPEQAFLADDAAGLRRAFDGIDPQIADAHVRTLTDPGAMTAALNWYRAWDDSLDEVAPIAVPTLFVWSDDDVALGRTGAEATVQWITGPYRFVELDGLSHWIPEVAPERLSAEIIPHLEQH